MKNNRTGTPPENPTSGEFDRFRELTDKLIRTPKVEIEKAEAEYQKKKNDKKKRRPG